MNKLTVLLILILTFTITCTLMADTHSKEEVQGLIDMAEKKIDELKKNNVFQYAGYEISKIEFHINNTKKYLGEKMFDLAFYEIKTGNEYFKMIEARRELFNAQNEYDEAKRNNR
ncbi:MAG: hypothetical protein MUD12_08960 [Spirochaetes bacterium]|jgi:hypothetical protein|nr:hypothetical protein [Spirochaetota bacterium]